MPDGFPGHGGQARSDGLLLELLRQGDLAAVPAADADGGSPNEKVVRVSLDRLDAWPEDDRATALLHQVTYRLRHTSGTPARPRPGTAQGRDEPAAAQATERAIHPRETWLAAHPDATHPERATAEEHLRAPAEHGARVGRPTGMVRGEGGTGGAWCVRQASAAVGQ
ncbi:hypothetical protein ACWDE9_34645 [Streptomyces olivaceoviridis]